MIKRVSGVFKYRFVVMPKKNCSFYAVRRGRSLGVYNTWSECEAQVKGFKNATYKKFPTKEEALNFVNQETSVAICSEPQASNTLNVNGKRKHSETTCTSEDTSSKIMCEYAGDIDSEDTVVVYTDGASSNNGFTGAQAGIGVYWGPDHPMNTSKRLPGRQTNNRAEIHAAVHALKQAKEMGAKNVKLYSDSKFLITGITDWIYKWKQNGWKLSGTGGPVINKEDFLELDAAREGLNVKWIYIKAHDGNDGNVQADRLAVAGAAKTLEESDDS